MEQLKLTDSVRKIQGVGPKRAECYAKVGVTTIGDLLYYSPKTYIDLTSPVLLTDAQPDENCVVRVRIGKKNPAQRIRQGLSLYKCSAEDVSGMMFVSFYNNRFVYDTLHEGEVYRLYGKLTLNYRHFEMNSPTVIPDDEPQQILPRYPLTEGLLQQNVASDVAFAIGAAGDTEDFLPDFIRQEYTLCTLDWAIKNLHFPQSLDSVQICRRRLAFDELVLMQCAMRMVKKISSGLDGCAMKQYDIAEFTDSLPFEMTGAQKKACGEIFADMCSGTPMNRLVQGDVGSGKTAVAAAACFLAYKNGYQSALMAPTEILAQQHYNTLTGFLSPLGINVGLLTGSMTAKRKREIKQELAEGRINVMIGTHALISESTEFMSLGLIITDEQHRFGVDQRKLLAQKGSFPHKLVMSATPIPRTLGLILYGDLDVSLINEMPKGRQKTETFAVTGKLRNRALTYVKNELEAGRQAYIVCPMIENNPDLEIQSVTEYAEMLKTSPIGGFTAALLHGRMSAEQKEEIMRSFKNGEIQVLVSTTVIEVGVDVPNATIIMIESAERFGLSQLHQLRGRVGRGGGRSSCILLTDNPTDEVRERLKIMSRTSDGFAIAEEDLKMRGAGDFFGKRQSGMASLRFADLYSDRELITQTSAAANELFRVSPDLSEFPELRARTEQIMQKNGTEGMN